MSEPRYEILAGLPGEGPMYIPVSETGEPFYYEGFVVRFFKSDGTTWVANFNPGMGGVSLVVEYPSENHLIVISKGQGYIMTPDQERPIATFGDNITEVARTEDGRTFCADGIYVQQIDATGIVWQSERISWDGIKDLKIQENILTGLSYDPTNSLEDWNTFSIDLDSKEVKGGSYRAA